MAGEPTRRFRAAPSTVLAKAVRRGLARGTASWRVTPDYLVIGTKRGGTTSLQAYLAAHPNVVEPNAAKSSHYFDVAYDRSWSWYRAHFPTKGSMARLRKRVGPVVVGEASPYYSFHPLALERIAKRLPDVKMIYLVRDPVLRAWSHYSYEKARGFEDLDFVAALDAEAERLDGAEEAMRLNPRYVDEHHRHHAYLARGKYADHVQRVYQLFPRDQLLVVASEHLFADPVRTMSRICAFLGIPDHVGADYQPQNANDYDKIEPAIRERLCRYYARPNERLFNLIGEQFPWLAPSASARQAG